MTLEPDGRIHCATSITDQGQGTRVGLAQIIADELGVDFDAIEITTGDTQATPFGGGAWASRGLALGGEAGLRAARRLKQNVLTIAGALVQTEAAALSVKNGAIHNAAGLLQMSLADLAATAVFKSHTIPLTELPALEVVESFAPREQPYVAANGIQAAHVELDPDTGSIRVLDFWVVEDCGRVINPMLVDGQIRGGVVQGIGAALYEQCIYGADGQLGNASLADYLVPMAREMPQIHIAHVETPTSATALGARGVGEAGTVGRRRRDLDRGQRCAGAIWRRDDATAVHPGAGAGADQGGTNSQPACLSPARLVNGSPLFDSADAHVAGDIRAPAREFAPPPWIASSLSLLAMTSPGRHCERSEAIQRESRWRHRRLLSRPSAVDDQRCAGHQG